MESFPFYSSPLSRCGPGGLLSSPPNPNGSFSPHSQSLLSTCSVEPITTSTGPSTNRRAARERERDREDKRSHIKKPLNAFMLYMKEMRPKIVAECTLKESAAINQILGRRVSNNKFISPQREDKMLWCVVAQPESRGASQILRGSSQSATTPHANVSGLVSQGQLCSKQKEETQTGVRVE